MWFDSVQPILIATTIRVCQFANLVVSSMTTPTNNNSCIYQVGIHGIIFRKGNDQLLIHLVCNLQIRKGKRKRHSSDKQYPACSPSNSLLEVVATVL